MRDRRVATRYAEALLLSAKKEGVLDSVAESFAGVLDAVKGNLELRIFMDSPQVRTEEKKELLQTVFGDAIEPLLLHFFLLLIDKNRIENTRDIGEVFAELVERDRGVQHATVVTAVPMPTDLAERLRTVLDGFTKTTVVLDLKIDPDVIGGVHVQLGDKVLDGTVRTNLDELARELGKARVH
jgi:F-type H+-transporting ATPase subunit delta